MNKTTTICSLGWIIGLILLITLTIQAESIPRRIAPGQLIQSSEIVKLLAPAVDLPPISRTATVGESFSLLLPELLPIVNGQSYASFVTGLPANGLKLGFISLDQQISGVPITAGVMNLTFIQTNTTTHVTNFVPITLTINPIPPTPPISRTATVGQAFNLLLPELLPLINGQSYASFVTGLPANGLKLGFISLDQQISGVPITAGVMNLTFIQTNTTTHVTNFVPITLTINGDLTLLAPTYNCATGAFHFNTSGGDGSPITFFAIGITGPTTNPDQFVDTELRTAADAPLITLSATQNGTTVTYLWNIRAQCPVGSGPPPGGALTLLAPTYNCATGAFHFNTSGGDGSPITFFAIGITGSTTNPDQFVDTGLRTAADAPLITLSATQNGTTVTYLWDIRAQCPVGSPPSGGALTLLAPTYNCATGAFRFNTSGGDGSPITFLGFGITGPTTNPDQFVDTELRTVNDVQPFLLQATQNGTTVTYLWNLKADCGRARLAVAEPAPGLTVLVLGNPVVGELVHIEVGGAEGQPLRVGVINQQGRLVSEKRIGLASALERLSIKLSPSPSVYLLQVSIPSQTTVVRVLKND